MNPLEIQQLVIDQRRGRYVRVSDADRRQLIETYKKGEDFIALAKKLNIKRSTARSILRTYIDEGRVLAKQRAGTRLRFITEQEAEMIREMKRRHPLITIGQIQMRLQRTSNRVLSKASISRILTNSIRLGKRAKRSVDGEPDDQDAMSNTMVNGHDELMQLSSDEGTGGAVYIDDEVDDDDDDELTENHGSMQNLDDFQRFMLRKTSVNGDESVGNDDASWDTKEHFDENGNPSAYTIYPSEDEDELSEMDESEIKSPTDLSLQAPSTQPESHPVLSENDNWTPVKSEPVCVFVNRSFDSSDSEHVATADEEPTKPILNAQSTANRRIKVCPICGEKNFSRLSHHLTVAHNLNREESLTLLAYADENNTHKNTNNNHSSIATVSSSSPINGTTIHPDKSPQQTPININTNNQQLASSGSSPPTTDSDNNNHNHNSTPNATLTASSSPNDHQSLNYLPIDGKKRLLCPRCKTWVLNLTDHLIKKHHLVSKQERLPFLRLARNRHSPSTTEKPSTNSFLISPNDQQTTSSMNKRYQNIIQKYRDNTLNSLPASSSSTASMANHETSSTANLNQNLLTANHSSKQNLTSRIAHTNKDVAVHQKFEQRLSVFRQQFAVTVAMQNSLMQQMELLQRSFVSIEDEWNDMKKEICESIS